MEKGRVLWAMSTGRATEGHRVAMGLFEKELLRVGRWVHPARKFVLEVTRERLKAWAKNFHKMLEKGIRVPVPYGHSYDPRDNAGFVRDMRVEGDRLVGVFEIPREEDAARVGSVATDVSISVNPDFSDGRGERLGEVIEHVAITNYPVVSGQEGFVPVGERAIAASGEGEGIVRLRLERTDERMADGEDECEEAEADSGDEAQTAGEREVEAGTEEEDGEHLTLDATAEESAGEPAAQVSQWAREEREALLWRIGKLEEERLDREVEGLVLSGKVSPAVEPNVRRLLSAGERIQLSATGESISPAQELRAILEAMPAGAWVPVEERAAGAKALERREVEISDERAIRLARENAEMLRKGGGRKTSS